MILYKYYSYDSGIEALKSRKLGFRTPNYFNDPFELSLLNYPVVDEQSDNLYLEHLEKLKRHVGILCFSRSFSNPLMWAHYAKSNQGIVIGYNVNHNYLFSEHTNIIPVTRGDVIYSNNKPILTKPTDKFPALDNLILTSLGRKSAYTPEYNELLKQFFLTKHISWAYEEEVRVVKPLNPYLSEHRGLFGTFKTLEGDSSLYLLDKEADIKTVYFGANCSSDYHVIMKEDPSILYFKMMIESHSWKLIPNALNPK